MDNRTTRVAVYGSLREGMGNHGCLGESEKVCEKTISGWQMVSLGGFPAVRKGEGDIMVEVYEASPATCARLNRLEGYTDSENDFYDREIVSIDGCDCLIYTFNHLTESDWANYAEHPVEGGDWKVYHQEPQSRYWRGR